MISNETQFIIGLSIGWISFISFMFHQAFKIRKLKKELSAFSGEGEK